MLATTCAALGIAAPVATGKTIKFQGPVNQPFIPSTNGFATDMPSVELKVNFDGKKPTTVIAGTLKVKGIYGPCGASNGCKPVCVTGAACEAPQCFPAVADLEGPVKVKNGRFSVTLKLSAETFTTITGRVTKKSVSGTVRGVDDKQAVGPNNPAYTCDTGVLTWKATK